MEATARRVALRVGARKANPLCLENALFVAQIGEVAPDRLDGLLDLLLVDLGWFLFLMVRSQFFSRNAILLLQLLIVGAKRLEQRR